MMKKFYVNTQSFGYKYARPKGKMFPTGSRIYTGHQGTGKTLSMVEYCIRIKKEFPRCRIYSNIILCDIDYIYISQDKLLDEALMAQNGEDGVLILLDEAHLYFGKKNGIPLSVLTAISQQRKDRKRLVFSSQIWEELDISIRKQVKEIVECKTLLGCIQFNKIKDGYTLEYDKIKSQYVAQVIGYEIFKHGNELYNRYSTFQKIIRNKEMMDLPTARAPSGLDAAQSKSKSKSNFWS